MRPQVVAAEQLHDPQLSATYGVRTAQRQPRTLTRGEREHGMESQEPSFTFRRVAVYFARIAIPLTHFPFRTTRPLRSPAR